MGRKSFGALLVFFVAGGAFLGCSQEGTLVVKNDCTTEFDGYIDNQFVEIAPGDEVALTVYIGKKAFIIGPSDIGVEVTGYAWTKREFVSTVNVESDATTIYSITDDVGAIRFQNAYSLQINEISTKLCDSPEFDESLLSTTEVLAPGTTMLIQLEANCWDILVDYGRDRLLDTVRVTVESVGQVIPIAWTPGYEYQPAAYARLPR